MAHETQYCSFRYILGTEYSGKTEASEISPAHRTRQSVFVYGRFRPILIFCGDSRADGLLDVRIAADSTMFLMVNLFIALSFGVQREQLEHLIGLTWPRPFLLRPLRCAVSTASGLAGQIAALLGRPLLDHVDLRSSMSTC